MNEGEHKVAEKTGFNGNLALLRVCAIILIVNVLSMVTNMLLIVGQGGGLLALWESITTSSFEDIIAMIGLFVVSGMIGPVGLAVLPFVCALALGIFALVKKNVIALKIAAILVIALGFVGPLMSLRAGGAQSAFAIIACLVINLNIVVAVATFFIRPKKHAEEIKDAQVDERFNLGLYRFCAVSFLVIGLNGVILVISGSTSAYVLALLSFATMLGGIIALVKKNSLILMVCSLLMFAQFFVAGFQLISAENLPENARFFVIVHSIVNSIINPIIAVCVAAFFVEPERTKRYLQKIKHS